MFNFIYFTFIAGLRELEFFVLLVNVHSLQGFCCEKRFIVLVIGPFAFFLIKSISIQTKPYVILRYVQLYIFYFYYRINEAWIHLFFG
jgi:hypothetical protein